MPKKRTTKSKTDSKVEPKADWKCNQHTLYKRMKLMEKKIMQPFDYGLPLVVPSKPGEAVGKQVKLDLFRGL